MRRIAYVLTTVLALGAAWWIAGGREGHVGELAGRETEPTSAAPTRGPVDLVGARPAAAVLPEPLPIEPSPWPALASPLIVEVVDDRGAPAGAVTVRVGGADVAPIERRTDASGRATFDPPPDPRDLVWAVDVRAADDGGARATTPVLVADVNPRRLVLASAWSIAGTVVETWGVLTDGTRPGEFDVRRMRRPVPGARVRLRRLGSPARVADDAVADAEGRYALTDHVAPEERRPVDVLLTAEAEGGRLRGATMFRIEAAPTRARFELEVQRGVPVRGVVVDADGRRVAGAAVRVRSERDVTIGSRMQPWGEDGVTDARGAFDVLGPRVGGPYVVVAEPPPSFEARGRPEDAAARGMSSRWCRPGRSTPFPVAEGTAEVSVGAVVLRRAGGVAIAVLDRDAAPVRPAVVTVEREKAVVVAETWSVAADDPEGVRFHVGGLEGGAWRVRVRGRLFEEATQEVEVVEGQDVVVTVVVRIGVRVTGVARDDDGRPVAGAAIEIVGPAEPPATGTVVVRHATSDAQGAFDVAMLPAGPLAVRASAPGLSTLGTGIAFDGSRRDVGVVLKRLGRARLVLTTSDGRPLPASATVTIGEVARPLEAQTSEVPIVDGVLVILGLTGVAQEVTVDLEGFAPFAQRVVALPGREIDLGRVVVSAGHRVVGRVLDDEGRPVPHARVVAAGDRFETTTDADGRFLLDGLPEGVVGISVAAEGYEEHAGQATVRGADAAHDVTLVRAAIVEGVVQTKAGTPADGERLEFVQLGASSDGLRGDALPAAALRTDDDGSFRVALPPGRYRIQARERDRLGDTLAEVVVERGVVRALRLSLPR